MPRYTYVAILAVAAFVFWMWQGENIRGGLLDNDDTATDQPEAETRRALTPAEKSAYADAVKTAIREKVAVYKGRVRLSEDILDDTVYVPIPLISVSCGTFFGVALMAPGSEGEQASPVGMVLVGLFDEDNEGELQETVIDALDGAEFMDEMCRMVVDELERLASQ